MNAAADLRPLIADGSPFTVAVAWLRLMEAEMAVQNAVGPEHPAVAAVNEVRAAVWDSLYDRTDYEERDAALANARCYLAERTR